MMNYTTKIRRVNGFRQGLQIMWISDQITIYCFPPLSLLTEFLFSFRNNCFAQSLMGLHGCYIINSGVVIFFIVPQKIRINIILSTRFVQKHSRLFRGTFDGTEHRFNKRIIIGGSRPLQTSDIVRFYYS